MAWGSKGDFYGSYRAHAVLADGRRMACYTGPENNYKPTTVLFSYLKLDQMPSKQKMADRLIAEIGISSSDRIVIFGGAFGWLGNALQDKTGCVCASVDTSEWINAEKDKSHNADVRESIIAGGLDPESGLGFEISQKYNDPSPRSNIPVLNEMLDTPKSKGSVRNALGGLPTRIITEEVWQTLTPIEQSAYNTRFAEFGIPVTHIVDGKIL